ncbi:chaperone modulator CbpM [Noviherbaspirillum denitrificans]|uniref:MerR family transcriptional regulator n=1 Tax=Noviherbaspirillum denitrificans TaxID=1968433 RepID=A0A254TAK9_9BURK|nr:chaperone modulator CbpM [Noviherbaspirillum denitrificans]OWW19664.1 MerR family transcriptional regulator [Noviherbaspirillum denitrificans]
MSQQHIAILLDEARLTLDELAASCTVSREWIIEHVHAGVLLADYEPDPAGWMFSGRDVLRARRMSGLERDFDANPELAGLVADLLDELERLRARVRRAGLSLD